MQYCHQTDTNVRKNSSSCLIHQYPVGDSTMDLATVMLNGRYPSKGYAVNLISKEMVYVLNGNGVIVVDNNQRHLLQGDVVFIPEKTPYYWEGQMSLNICCNPAFKPAQHQL